MDIHKPHAPHSWGEFAREIATIVAGILIALGLEQGIQWWHDRQVADQARAAVRDEIAADLGILTVIESTYPCAARRLDEIARLIDLGSRGTPLGTPINPGVIRQKMIHCA